MAMTHEEKVLWEYIEAESTELLLKVRDDIHSDGFDQSMPNSSMAAEIIGLKILSHAMIKMLAMLVENTHHTTLASAYLKLAPMHSELIKLYLLKEKP